MFDGVNGAGGMDGVGDVGEVDRVDRVDRTDRMDEARGAAGPPKAPPGSNGRPVGRRAATGRRLAAVLLVLPVLAAAGLVLGAGEATAAALCPGRLVKTVTFSTGSLRVYKSRAYACAVTVAKKPGARREMKVSLQPRGGRAVVDQGKFTTRAGPVRVHALNRCVRASGSVGGSAGSTGWIGC
ncbi:hypothetical protein GA0115249_120212 [Streptomyces sp. PpalLS-921]|nr:hypothetical protein GA0115249_120212 [Streptomyces sp. PpalLS-921]